MKRKTNPNGANQYQVDPRQALFLASYLDPKSETFGNCLQSALKAGYGEEYSKALMAKMPTWLSEKVKHSDLVVQAEKNLKTFLSDSYTEHDKIKADITKFTLERLKKDDYSTRQEQTGKDGKAIQHEYVPPAKLTKEERLKFLTDFLGN